MLTEMTFTPFACHLGLLAEEIVLGSVLDVPVVRSKFYRRRPLLLYDKTLAGASRALNRRGFLRSFHRPRSKTFTPPRRVGCTPLSASAGLRPELVPHFPDRDGFSGFSITRPPYEARRKKVVLHTQRRGNRAGIRRFGGTENARLDIRGMWQTNEAMWYHRMGNVTSISPISASN